MNRLVDEEIHAADPTSRFPLDRPPASPCLSIAYDLALNARTSRPAGIRPTQGASVSNSSAPSTNPLRVPVARSPLASRIFVFPIFYLSSYLFPLFYTFLNFKLSLN